MLALVCCLFFCLSQWTNALNESIIKIHTFTVRLLRETVNIMLQVKVVWKSIHLYWTYWGNIEFLSLNRHVASYLVCLSAKKCLRWRCFENLSIYTGNIQEKEFLNRHRHVALCFICLSEKNAQSESIMRTCPFIVEIFRKSQVPKLVSIFRTLGIIKKTWTYICYFFTIYHGQCRIYW